MVDVRVDGLVDVVVFDLGNVLIPWDRRRLYAKLIDDDAELDHFLDTVLTMDVNASLDRGTPIQEVVDALIARHDRAYHDLIQAFADRWPETVDHAIAGSVELLEALVDGGVPCYALSNWGRDTFELVEARYPFLQRFAGRVISGYEGVVKPEPEIFELLCDRYGFAPRQALFIDDSSANITAAEQLGFAVHLFTDPPSLRRDLVARGLLAA
ncbi:MAG: HAD family phosphatase [Actinomycetota bacterium]